MIRLQTVREKGRDLLWNIHQKYLYEMINFYDDSMDENGNYHPYNTRTGGRKDYTGGEGKSQVAERTIDKAKAKRMAEFEEYALGKKKSYGASIDEVKKLRKKHESLMEQLSEADDKVRELNRMKVHESFAVTKLTKELLDEYVESIEVHPGEFVSRS